MNTIVFNGDASFGVESYNKSTNFEGENISSSGYASLITTDIDALTAVAQEPITSIQILHDGDSIYNSTNLNAKITNINEYLSDNRISVNISFIFN